MCNTEYFNVTWNKNGSELYTGSAPADYSTSIIGNGPSAPKPLITPFLTDFSRFFPVFPWTSGCVLWIPGVQTLKMGEKWGKMGKKWVRNGNYGG